MMLVSNGKKPAHESISKAEHDAALQQLSDDNEALRKREIELSAELSSANTTVGSLRDAIAEIKPVADAKIQLDAQFKVQAAEIQQLNTDLSSAKAELDATQKERDNLREQRDAANGDVRTLTERLKNVTKQLSRQEEWVNEQTKHFKSEITVLTHKLLKQQSDEMGKINQDNVKRTLEPLNKTLSDFEKRLSEVRSTQAKQSSEMSGHISALLKANQEIGGKAEKLAEALTTRPKTRGSWGELALRRLFEDAGLEEGKTFVVEKNLKTEEGANVRPDFMLLLPEGRSIVIDSKVSMESWRRVCDAEDEASRVAAIRDLKLSMNQHVKSLSGKNYPSAKGINTVDWVIMFVPIEAALVTLLQEDPEFAQAAAAQRVHLCGPTLLLPLLSLVRNQWVVHEQDHNAEKIVIEAGKLYNKARGFLEHFERLGNSLQTMNNVYEKGRTTLVSGQGNFVRQLQRFEELGARYSGKKIDSELVDEAAQSHHAAIANPDSTEALAAQSELPESTEAQPELPESATG